MKITITLDTAAGDHKSKEAIALLGGSVLLSIIENNMVEVRQHDTMIDDAPDPEEYNPDARIYGEKGEKARRTKDEMAQDEGIKARWSALWPSKDVPAKPVGELLAHIAKIEAEQPEEEEGFDLGATDEQEEILELEEFRAIIVKHSKALGNKRLSAIMAPHKNPSEVPEAERRDFADRIIEAAADAE